MGAKKNFVIDTNVILHDYNCLKNFQENDIYLPIVVLEELDKFKKGNEQINFNAREFLRELDLVTDDNLFNKGASLGEGLGSLFVIAGSVDAPDVFDSFPERIPDHKILAVVDWLTRQKKDMKTILVTKDVNLRMKARSIGLLCEDYINDKVINVDIFEKSNEVFEGIDPALIDRIYSSREGLDISEFDFKDIIHPNECFILKSDRNSVLARYNPFTHSICRVNKTKNYGIEPRNAEQSFAFEILNDPNVKLVALTGKAGTGKTLLATEYLKLISNLKDIVKIDLSEYKEYHMISKLIGTTAGYLGYDNKNNIFEKVRSNPSTTFIVENFSQACTEVKSLFERILSDGKIEDASGTKIDFTNSVIIFENRNLENEKKLGFTNDDKSNLNLPSEIKDKVFDVIELKKLTNKDKEEILINKINNLIKNYDDAKVKLPAHYKEEILKLISSSKDLKSLINDSLIKIENQITDGLINYKSDIELKI